MKAVVFRRHGGPETLETAVLPLPEPGPGEARVSLKAAALNHLDIWVRNGLGATIPMPHIGGSDGAGVVEAVGAGVANVKPGDAALIAPGLSCGLCAECRSGRDSRCPNFRILGFQTQGTYATHVVVPSGNLLPIPEGLDFPEAAAIPLVFLTAHHMLFARGALRPGETVYVPGAASGVGSAAIQLAAVAGARVIASASSPEKSALGKRLGAEVCVDASSASLADDVRRATGGRGVDLVVDHVGGDHLALAVSLCARGGRVVSCGATAGATTTLAVRALYASEISLVGAYMGGRGELHDVLRLFAQRRLQPVVDRTYPLELAAEAQRRMEARQNLGKLVLRA
jgi:NADPH:quinone reductase-like Zn-dependent oxidoreductase